MRGFIVLCFAALSSAAPGIYNYPSGVASVVEHHEYQPLVTKNFYIHSAPEANEIEVQHHDILVGTPRKNYNVVFVKAPSNPLQKTKVRIIPAVKEDKTAIYVLSKKADAPHLETYVEEPVTTTAKPEVHFIKYKTNAEAEHAQHSIQAEYDRLGGSTIVSNEGVSPISSVIGSLDDILAKSVVYAKSIDTSNSVYLPTVKKH